MIAENVVFSVSELNEYVNVLLGHDPYLGELTVRGEISGFKRHISGHLYFTLKDDSSSVKVVMFKYNALRLTFFPKEGQSVEIKGHAGLYDKDGSFQVYAESMTNIGDGNLFLKFAAYKAELEKKGWFDQELKKTIPFLPQKVGVVTSSTGAAIEDIRKVIGGRFPSMPVLLYPAQVQGECAAKEIAAAIRRADEEQKVDVLIVGRGGGSMEDLWAFNESEVAVAVHECSLPVVSAVGHEIDFTICDFVADVRAATPSAAAEIVVPEYASLRKNMEIIKKRLLVSFSRGCEEKRSALAVIAEHAALKSPARLIEKHRLNLENLHDSFFESVEKATNAQRMRLALVSAVLEGFSPKALLNRGYLLASNEKGELIHSAYELKKGDTFSVKFKDGTVQALTIGVNINAEAES